MCREHQGKYRHIRMYQVFIDFFFPFYILCRIASDANSFFRLSEKAEPKIESIIGIYIFSNVPFKYTILTHIWNNFHFLQLHLHANWMENDIVRLKNFQTVQMDVHSVYVCTEKSIVMNHIVKRFWLIRLHQMSHCQPIHRRARQQLQNETLSLIRHCRHREMKKDHRQTWLTTPVI